MQAIDFSQGQLMGLDFQATSMAMRMVDTGRGSTPDVNIDAFGRGGGEAPVAAAGSLVAERRPTGSSIQRSSRRRRDSGGTIVRVPALRTGNTEIPPDDGYTWRKYGQKDILRSRFPRSYYRCTHKSYYGCNAKKQVQRLDEDPYTYEIKYCGTHSCKTSTTPLLIPSITPNTNNASSSSNNNPPGEAPMPEATAQPPSSLPTSTQLGIWFSREFDHGQREIPSLVGSSTQAGPSNMQGGGRDIDCPVAALADVMFNSGSSGSSMDAIFSQPRQDS
uniref:WRKY transcription factor 55 n=2 Tax=Elaeis guineensis var. tenera TaxID=51953 RepID=A0A6I9R6P8_ELAGV|nr:WRKY transcription factor 55 [Elaeis guineensis]